MNDSAMTKVKAVGRLVFEGARLAADKLSGKPSRPFQALSWVERNARAGDPASVLAALDDFGRNRRFLMNVGDEKGPLLSSTLRDAVAGVAAPRVLELGCYCGYSAILMASELPDGGHLTSIELDPGNVQAATRMVDFAGCADRVTIVQGSAGDVIPTLQGRFELVFLDHWKNLYLSDLQAIERAGLLHEGSVVFADNVGPAFGMQAYLDYVRSSPRYESRYVRSHVEYTSIEDGCEISTVRPMTAPA